MLAFYLLLSLPSGCLLQGFLTTCMHSFLLHPTYIFSLFLSDLILKVASDDFFYCYVSEVQLSIFY